MAIINLGGEVLPYGTRPPAGAYNYTIEPAPEPAPAPKPSDPPKSLYVPPSEVYKDKQTFDPKVLSTPKFGDLVLDGSEFNNAGTKLLLSNEEMASLGDKPAGTALPEKATNLTFKINGSYYTFHPSNILEKGFVVDKKQFYNPDVLKNLDKVYEQGQPISLKGVGWYDDFLKKNDLSTEGVLMPAGFTNGSLGSFGDWRIADIGSEKDNIRWNEITGIGKVGDQYVYTANVDPVGVTSAYGYYDATGGKGEWFKEKGGLLGKVSRAIAKVPFGAEAIGLATGNPMVYAVASGLRGGATGEDPLKVGLKTGAAILAADLASDVFGGAPTEAAPVGGTPGVSEVFPVDMSVGGTVTQLPPATPPGAFEIADAAQLSAQGLSPQYTSTILQQQYGLSPIEAKNLSLLGEDIAFASADAAQLWKTTGDVAAVQQNLITAGVDPTISADLANRAALGGSVTDLAMGTADAFGSSPIFTSQGLLSGGSTLDDFAKDIGGNISSTGSTISLNDAFRAARLGQSLLGGEQQQQRFPNQQLPDMQASGVDVLRLPQLTAGVPNVASLLSPVPYRGPYFDIYTGIPSLLG